jgi:hypothetical protein
LKAAASHFSTAMFCTARCRTMPNLDSVARSSPTICPLKACCLGRWAPTRRVRTCAIS